MDLGAGEFIDSNLPFIDLNSEIVESDAGLIKKKTELIVLGKKIGFAEGGGFRENLVYSNGLYTGQMSRNKRTGIGIFIFFNNVMYHGCWGNDRPNGAGILKFECGEYEGNFLNGNFDGFGKYSNKGYKYKGYWENNFKSGNGRESENFNTVKYDGEFFMNMRHGNGVLKINSTEFEVKYNNGTITHLKPKLNSEILITQTAPSQYTISKLSQSGQPLELTLNLSLPHTPTLILPNQKPRPLKLLNPHSPHSKFLTLLPPTN